MFLSKIAIGENPPEDLNVIIENPKGGEPVKYELDKNSGAMMVDRFLHTSMAYPGNYGFIPHTLSEDGDPVDCLVISSNSVMPGAILKSRPVGVLIMEDEAGMDEKILAVPVPKLHPYHNNIKDIKDIRPILLDVIEHFFSHYKDLEPNKWVKTVRWGSADEAKQLIIEGIDRAKSKSTELP